MSPPQQPQPQPQMQPQPQPQPQPQQQMQQAPVAQPAQPQQQQPLMGAPGGAPLNWQAPVGETGNTVLEVLSAAKKILAQNPELSAKVAQQLTSMGISPDLLRQGQ